MWIMRDDVAVSSRKALGFIGHKFKGRGVLVGRTTGHTVQTGFQAHRRALLESHTRRLGVRCMTHFPTPPSEMPYTLVGFKPGDKSIFSVNIDSNKSVDQLKKEIKTSLDPKLKDVATNDLTLYKVNVDMSDYNQYDQIIKEMSRSDYRFPQKEKLVDIAEISRYFQKDSGSTVEVLVEIPPGELIKSMPCAMARPDAEASPIPQHRQDLQATCRNSRLLLLILANILMYRRPNFRSLLSSTAFALKSNCF
jgi:hypothetical protein